MIYKFAGQDKTSECPQKNETHKPHVISYYNTMSNGTGDNYCMGHNVDYKIASHYPGNKYKFERIEFAMQD